MSQSRKYTQEELDVIKNKILQEAKEGDLLKVEEIAKLKEEIVELLKTHLNYPYYEIELLSPLNAFVYKKIDGNSDTEARSFEERVADIFLEYCSIDFLLNTTEIFQEQVVKFADTCNQVFEDACQFIDDISEEDLDIKDLLYSQIERLYIDTLSGTLMWETLDIHYHSLDNLQELTDNVREDALSSIKNFLHYYLNSTFTLVQITRNGVPISELSYLDMPFVGYENEEKIGFSLTRREFFEKYFSGGGYVQASYYNVTDSIALHPETETMTVTLGIIEFTYQLTEEAHL